MPTRVLTLLCCTAALIAQEKPPLRGQVVDEQGRPMAGVAVCTFAEGQRWTTAELVKVATLRTDALGKFQLADAPAVQPPDWDSVLVVAPGRLSMVVARHGIDFAPIVMSPGAVLAGRILDAKGAPIVGARVQASDYLREVAYLDSQSGGRRLNATPIAAARTDARGAFVLTGACGTAACLVADGDGWYEVSLGPVSALDPLTIVLEPAPLLRGRIVDPENGAVGDLLVQMVRTSSGERGSRWTRSDRAGAFTFPWPGASVRLSLSVPRGEQRWIAGASVDDPAAERVLTLSVQPPRDPAQALRSNHARKVEPEQIVSVRAVGPDGQPLTTFRASAHHISRGQRAQQSDLQQLRVFETAAVAAVDGVAAAPVFEGTVHTGILVIVEAPGMALTCDGFDATSTSVEVKLQRAAVIAGKVLDARSGKPLAGVRVWSLPKSDQFRPGMVFQRFANSDPGFGVVTTDAAGAFRLEQVAAGSRHVSCQLPGHADRPPELVEIAAGGERLDVRLELAPMLDVDGRLAGGVPPRTKGVRLKKHTPGSWTSSEATDYSSTFAVDAQGRFRATGLAPGQYEAQLVVLLAPRQGLPQKLPLELVDIGVEGKALEFDGTMARLASVTGRVTGPVPATRLAVVSSAAPAGNHYFGYLCYEGSITPLDPDGSFSLEEPPGIRILVVIDLWTGAMLHREPKTEVAPGSERTVELAVEAVPVQFRITGAAIGWHWLEIVPAPEHWPTGVGQIAALRDQGYSLRMGARLEPGRTEGVFYLPAAPCTLRLRTAASLSHTPTAKDALARWDIDPSQANDRNVTMALPPK